MTDDKTDTAIDADIEKAKEIALGAAITRLAAANGGTLIVPPYPPVDEKPHQLTIHVAPDGTLVFTAVPVYEIH